MAVAQFLRLLPQQQLRAFDPRRSAGLGPGSPGDALGNQPRLYGNGNPGSRLARRSPRAAGTVLIDDRGRRGDPGSASSAAFCAILAARSAPGPARAASLVAYASTQTHSSVEKGLRRRAGKQLASPHRRRRCLGHATRSPGRALAADVAAGRRPFFVCATVGTTSSLGFDPLRSIASICRQYNVWLHVDAALAGTAAICPEFR